MRSFPQRGGWFLLCRAQWVLCQFFLFLPVCLSQAGVLKQAGTASLGFMDERDTLCLSMPHSFFDCKPSKALLSTTLGKNQIRCRVFAISTKFSEKIFCGVRLDTAGGYYPPAPPECQDFSFCAGRSLAHTKKRTIRFQIVLLFHMVIYSTCFSAKNRRYSASYSQPQLPHSSFACSTAEISSSLQLSPQRYAFAGKEINSQPESAKRFKIDRSSCSSILRVPPSTFVCFGGTVSEWVSSVVCCCFPSRLFMIAETDERTLLRLCALFLLQAGRFALLFFLHL